MLCEIYEGQTIELIYCDLALYNPLSRYILLFNTEKGFFPVCGIVSGGRVEFDEVR